MPTTKAQQNAANKYIKEKYDRINLVLPKGWKELITDYVVQQQKGETVNSFIKRAIETQMEREI